MSILCHFQLAEGTDYIPLIDAEVTFLAGNEVGTVVCENVTIVDDMDTIEPDQTFMVSANSSDPVIITPNSQVVITIVDNDGEK